MLRVAVLAGAASLCCEVYCAVLRTCLTWLIGELLPSCHPRRLPAEGERACEQSAAHVECCACVWLPRWLQVDALLLCGLVGEG